MTKIKKIDFEKLNISDIKPNNVVTKYAPPNITPTIKQTENFDGYNAIKKALTDTENYDTSNNINKPIEEIKKMEPYAISERDGSYIVMDKYNGQTAEYAFHPDGSYEISTLDAPNHTEKEYYFNTKNEIYKTKEYTRDEFGNITAMNTIDNSYGYDTIRESINEDVDLYTR